MKYRMVDEVMDKMPISAEFDALDDAHAQIQAESLMNTEAPKHPHEGIMGKILTLQKVDGSTITTIAYIPF